MKFYHKTIQQIIEENKLKNKGVCPLDIGIIPNHMGINLCAVDSIAWQKQDDGQLTSLTIYFIPADK